MNTTKLRNRIFAVLVLFAVVAATAFVTVAAPADTNTGVSNNGQIVKKIRRELARLPYYGVFDNLAFKVEGDTVTLYGQVVRPTTRDGAARRVSRIEGVRNVVNKIEVLPVSPFDDDIRLLAYREVFGTGGLYRYAMGANPSVHIVVNRGHLTLEGVVNNKLDKRLAEFAARSVPGVFSVTNNLRATREEAR